MCIRDSLFAGTATTLPKTVFSSDKPPHTRIAIVRAEPLEASSDKRGIGVPGTPMAKRSEYGQPWAGSTLQGVNAPAQGSTLPEIGASRRRTTRIPIGPEEASIPLQKWTTVRSSFGSIRIKVRKDGPGTISVWYDQSNEPRRFEKKSVSEAYGTNVVQIHSLPGAKVYYVDRLTAPAGRCVLIVIPDA